MSLSHIFTSIPRFRKPILTFYFRILHYTGGKGKVKVVRSLISLKYLLISGCVNITDLGRPLIRARLAMWKIICNILYFCWKDEIL